LFVDLKSYSNSSFSHGKNIFFRFVWIICSSFFFKTDIPFPSKLKSFLLKLFGAEVGNGLIIRTNVNIKQPWCLKIGNNVWIGESVWIDNLVMVEIRDNVCISQGAMLLTGNHDYSKSSFDLITGQIYLDNGVWIGAKAIVGPNVHCGSHSVLSAGSTTFKNLESNSIYQGNPAQLKKQRIIHEKGKQ
jgi:putative colanic acid biosynthesis acetyltransferase WcaF